MNHIKKSLAQSQTIRSGIAIIFFLFICWIIYTSDIGEVNPYLKQLRDFPYGDKVAHFMLYGMLAFLVNLALNNRQIRIFGHSFLLAAVLVLVFAVVEEFTQIALATRNFELWDIACDIAGITLFSYGSEQFNRLLQASRY